MSSTPPRLSRGSRESAERAGIAFGDDPTDETPPWEVFALLSDETRFRILLALLEAPDRPLSFSELRERVAVRDSSRFNYHLDRLAGRFVDREGGRYDLTPRAERLLPVVLDWT